MTKQYIDTIIEQVTALEVFNCVFFKEVWETDKGVDDSQTPGAYFVRDGEEDDDEIWAIQNNPKDGVYLVAGKYKLVAWFREYDAEAVVATFINYIQKNRGTVEGISYNSREIYLAETETELRSDLPMIRINFEIQAPVTIRQCIPKILCKS